MAAAPAWLEWIPAIALFGGVAIAGVLTWWRTDQHAKDLDAHAESIRDLDKSSAETTTTVKEHSRRIERLEDR